VCKCTPSKRTPWCGAPSCEAPQQSAKQAAERRLDVARQRWVLASEKLNNAQTELHAASREMDKFFEEVGES